MTRPNRHRSSAGLLTLALSFALACVTGGWHAPALAADAALPAVGASFKLQGQTLDGKPFSIAELRGKVALVFFWRTDCAVCRSKMPELRANAAAWQAKPFALVTVNLDGRRAEALAYDRAVSATVAGSARLPTLWAGEPGYADSLGFRPSTLPLSVLIDAQGRVVAHYEGRIPAETWDRIADLLP